MLDHKTDKCELIGVEEKQLFKITNRPGGYYFIKYNRVYAANPEHPEVHGLSLVEVDDLANALSRGLIIKTEKRVY